MDWRQNRRLTDLSLYDVRASVIISRNHIDDKGHFIADTCMQTNGQLATWLKCRPQWGSIFLWNQGNQSWFTLFVDVNFTQVYQGNLSAWKLFLKGNNLLHCYCYIPPTFHVARTYAEFLEITSSATAAYVLLVSVVKTVAGRFATKMIRFKVMSSRFDKSKSICYTY